MRIKIEYVLPVMLVMLLSGCGMAAETEDGESTSTAVVFQDTEKITEESTQTADTFDAGREQKEGELALLETMDWKDLTCYADEKTAIRNSNLLNYGYLTTDEEGQLYFQDLNQGGIYTCGPRGEECRLFYSGNGKDLQIQGEWLYLNAEEGGIKRVHLVTGETEYIREEPCGEFILAGDNIYINGEEGFCVMTPEGTDKHILQGPELSMACYTAGDGFYFANAINDTDVEWFWKGYLLCYSEEKEELFLLREGATYPLLAGNWLSVFDANAATRYVWNLETKEEIDLKTYAQRVLSDGKYLYYVQLDTSTGGRFYKWDGTAAEKLWSTDETAELLDIPWIYLSEEYLYWGQKVQVGEEAVMEWWYYHLETGEAGKFY